MNGNDGSEDGPSLARDRSRRQRKDKGGRLAALEKFKQAKAVGQKWATLEVEEDNVYDMVDEEEYSKIVQSRQDDDWIVDDTGSGYVEDGREIFDEDDGENDGCSSKAKKVAAADRKKSKNPNIQKQESRNKNIRSMFMSAAVTGTSKKKPEKDITLNEDDDILGDILGELKNDVSMKPAAVRVKKSGSNSPFPSRPVSKSAMKKAASSVFSSRPLPVVMPLKPKMAKKPSAVAMKRSPVKREPVIELNSFDDAAVDISEIDSMDVAECKDEIIEIKQETPDEAHHMDISDINFDDEFADEMKLEIENDVKNEEEAASNDNAVKELSESWGTFNASGTTGVRAEELPVPVHVDSSKLPLTTNDSGEQIMRMYWLDAYEDPYKQPGVVYLFGKVYIESAKSHVSCCVAVKNIERRVYVLPREHKFDETTKKSNPDEVIKLMDVYKEFNTVLTEKYKINGFRSRKVVKEYSFDKADIPAESDYLEARYSAEFPTLPSELRGETFSHVFGTNTSCLELLLLDQKMKGPGWLDIKCPQLPNTNVSWCQIEAYVNGASDVVVIKESLAPPPLVVMTICLKTLANAKTHENEIISAACLLHQQFHIDKPPPKNQPFHDHFAAVTHPQDCIFPFDFRENVAKQAGKMKVEIMGSERGLLGFLLAKIHKVDPDVIVGHDVYSFDMDVLLHRISSTKVPHWSKIGRLRRNQMPKLSSAHGARFGSSYTDKTATCGRVVCDVKISAKELIRCRAYDLTELSNHILHERRNEIDVDEIKQMYNSSQQLLRLVELNLMDATFILRILYELNVLPLALQITNICGNVMSRTLMGGRSERNEFLLLHAFTEKNFIVPDKEYKKKTPQTNNVKDEDEDAETTGIRKKNAPSRKKPSYAGGLVLEPKKGFYDKFILLLDFNSLYPSIIQEYNICFTTITSTENKMTQVEGDDELYLELPDPGLEPGILPTEIRKLVQSRRQVKKLMNTPDLSPEMYMQYDIRQKALKLTANSMYGCLGFSHSRFYAKPLAALVTGKGREILMKTKDLVEKMNLDVIYGDTDSIMVNSNCTDIEQVYRLGNKIKSEVNRLYKLLEIDIDGIFKSMLLLKKKKYAALNMTKDANGKWTTTQELKGLDIVRRDWCELAKESGNFVVSQILSGEARETIVERIHESLLELGEKVKTNTVPVEAYYITKQLTKNPEDYPDKKSLPHVQVAVRLNSKGGKRLRAGDTVYYVICNDGSNLAASARAYHPEELSKSETLTIDTKYYLSNQVHPVVSRLCDPIDGTDAAHIAECLGLDASGYKHSHNDQNEEDAMLGITHLSEDEKYKDCERYTFHCPDCSRQIIIDGAFVGADTMIQPVLSFCPTLSLPAPKTGRCTCIPADHHVTICNQLSQAIRKHIRRYYENWLKCDDATCGSRTRRLPLQLIKGHPICHECYRGVLKQEYTDTQLYHQLCFYQYVFDPEKAISKMSSVHEKDLARKRMTPFRDYYKLIRGTVDKALNQSAYSEVNLTKLFANLIPLKSSSTQNQIS
ncbi:DNA polymerase alpha catalytic subunit-like [Tubulanus polymorphus]|uniref:DNA polymerase alpha catalytic subunit-like n=1 Tax=Tubulanus polymorphus TaxID=672921 RepID=UPI003DA4C79C